MCIGIVAFNLRAFEMVVDRHAECALGVVLPDHVLVEHIANLRGLRQFQHLKTRVLGVLLAQDLHAEANTFVADRHAGTGHQTVYLMLAFAAERAALHAVVIADHTSHIHPHSACIQKRARALGTHPSF